MNFQVVPFEAWHVGEFAAEEPQAAESLDLMDFEALVEHPSFSVFTDRVVACGGVVPMWPGRDLAWALISRTDPATFLKIHRRVARFFDERDCRRTEIAVNPNYPPAIRWAEMLGFRKETPDGMEGYNPDGATMDLYARIAEWHLPAR